MRSHTKIGYKSLHYVSKNHRQVVVFVAIIFTVFYIISLKMDNSLKLTNLTIKTSLNSSMKYLSSRLAAQSRLGNHLFEVAALLGISRVLNRTPVFFIEDQDYRYMLRDTNAIIPGIFKNFEIVDGRVPPTTKNTRFNEKCCIYQDPKVLLNDTSPYLHLTGNFYQSWKYFPGVRKEVISYIRDSSYDTFEGLPISDANTTVICVHARRGDFIGVNFAVANETFIRGALRFIEKKDSQRKLTALFGDDSKFLKDLFPDSIFSDSSDKNHFSKHVVSTNSPVNDLIYSKNHCDVVFITSPHSTFGWWMGYLSKGNKVYYTDIRSTTDAAFVVGNLIPEDYFIPDWIPLKFADDNVTVVETQRL